MDRSVKIKEKISAILQSAVRGVDETNRYGPAIRWGRVEKDIHKAVEEGVRDIVIDELSRHGCPKCGNVVVKTIAGGNLKCIDCCTL